MFERLKYKNKTKGFFNPDLNVDVSREQFLQILSGDIINPNRLVSPKRYSDYSFMLVGAPIDSPLNSLAGKTWGPYGFENAHACANWYAKICCENDSHIVFPKQNLFFHFDPCSEYNRGKTFNSVGELELAIFDGRPITRLDRDLKILISDLSAGEVLKYMRDYKRRFSAK